MLNKGSMTSFLIFRSPVVLLFKEDFRSSSLVVEDTPPFSSSPAGDTLFPPQEVTSGCVELSGDSRATTTAPPAEPEGFSVSSRFDRISVVLGLLVVLLASPFSTEDLLVVVVHMVSDLVEAVVVVKVEFRRPDWAWCEVVVDLKVGVTVAEGFVLASGRILLSTNGLMGTEVVEAPMMGKGAGLAFGTGRTCPMVGVLGALVPAPDAGLNICCC